MQKLNLNEKELKAKMIVVNESLFSVDVSVNIDQSKKLLFLANPQRLTTAYKERINRKDGSVDIISLKYTTTRYADILPFVRASSNDAKLILGRLVELFSTFRIVLPRGRCELIPRCIEEDPERLILLTVDEMKKHW